jgi:hypothetical protein
MIPEATPEPPIPPIQPGSIAAKVMRILEERDGRALEAAPLPTAKNGPRRPWYEERAINLRDSVTRDEPNANDPRSPEEAHQAIVYARQDIILVVSYLSSLNLQLRRVVWLLMAVVALLIVELAHR